MVAFVFIPIGIAIYVTSENVSRILIKTIYLILSKNNNLFLIKIFEIALEYNNLPQCMLNQTKDYGRTCSISYKFKHDVNLPVYVYYQLGNFYQNHRRYIKSRSDDQLKGKTSTSGCDPMIKGTNDKDLYPCGLIAHSYFSG